MNFERYVHKCCQHILVCLLRDGLLELRSREDYESQLLVQAGELSLYFPWAGVISNADRHETCRSCEALSNDHLIAMIGVEDHR